MANEINLSVKADLSKAIEALQKFHDHLDEVSDEFKNAGNNAEESLNNNVKVTENALAKMGSMAKNVLKNLKNDFKALTSMESLTAGLKLADQFKGSIRETINLSDAIRKLGESFGVSKDRFSAFQEVLTKGMGDIGLSSEEAGNVLKGLAGQGITGEGTVTEYAKTAGALSSLGGEKGRGGEIASGLAGIQKARGISVQDTKQMAELAQNITKAMGASGKTASELIGDMQGLFRDMDPDMKKKFGAQGAAQMGVVSAVAGPEATAFMKKLLSLNKEERMGLESQGLGKIFSANGTLNLKALKDIQKEMRSRGISTGLAAKTLGLTDEEGKGLSRLIDASNDASAALERMEKSSGDLFGKQKQNMGVTEAFQASMNKIKAQMAGPLSKATQGLTNMLSDASQSTAGAAGVVAGGGVLAAMLGGGGLRGIGGIIKGELGGEMYKSLTGKEIQHVWVDGGQLDTSTAAGDVAEKIAGGAAGGGMIAKAGGLISSVAPWLLRLAPVAAALTPTGTGEAKMPDNPEAAMQAWMSKMKPQTVQIHPDQFNKMVEDRKLRNGKPASRGASVGAQ